MHGAIKPKKRSRAEVGRTWPGLVGARRLFLHAMPMLVVSLVLLHRDAPNFMSPDAVASVRIQEQVHLNHPAGAPFEPLVDGSETPELIPDHLAQRVLVQTLSVSPNPSPSDRAEVEAKASRMNLSAQDMEILLRELGTFHVRAADQRDRIDSLRPAQHTSTPASIGRYAEEQARLGTMAVEAYDAMIGSLSPAGAAKLQEQLDYIKTRMKIYPTPDMSSGLTN